MPSASPRKPSRSPPRKRVASPNPKPAAAPAVGRTRETPHTIGKPWWLDDPDPTERDAKDRFVGQGWYAGIMLGYVVLAIIMLRFYPPAWATSARDVADSAVLSPLWLGVLRGAAALFVLLVVLSLTLSPAKSQSETTLDDREIFLSISGLWRLGGLTQSGWILIGLYLGASSAITLSVWASPEDAAHKLPSSWACGANSLLGVAFGFSLLITTVVTFVLVPGEHSEGRSVAGYFNLHDLVLHNANVALMTLEMLVGGLHVDFGDIAFVVLFGCTYLVWHQFIRFRYTRTLIYPFLSWKSPHAFKVASALVAALCIFFVLGGLVSEYLRPWQPWGPPVVALATCAIMRFRPPPPLPGAQKQG